MVASLSVIKSAGAAASYFAQVDDYYRGEEFAPASWQGSGAEALGLSGAVDSTTFKNLLAGRMPDGQQLGRIGEGGEVEHKPGWDMTFSAPKSVSIMALVAGDERLILAHEQAVRDTLTWLESEAAVTRVKERGGEARIEATGNLVVGTFRHATSRELQPQLHTHAVILNLTQREDGQWRSLESRPIFRLQMEAGERYRAALAYAVARLGYQVERTKVGESSAGFEIADVPKELMRQLSDRSAQVEEALAARGKTRETATAEEKDMAAVSTRKSKEVSDRATLQADWREMARTAGLESIQTRAAGQDDLASLDWRATQSARQAIAEACEHLSERDARFTESALLHEARILAMGQCHETDLQAAIAHATSQGDIEPRTARSFDHQTGNLAEGPGYTTRQAIEIEKSMLATAERARDCVAPLAMDVASAQLRQELRSGFRFNEGQAEALAGILQCRDRISLVQGYAGTAKTTTVLAAVAAEARAQGLQVTAIGPTRSAADTLGEAIGAEGVTVAKHITARTRAGGLWIVDEGSLVSARDTEKLLRQAEQAGARVVMVGDVKQLGSVEAGAAFRQLQADSGQKTFVLDEIVRQTNKATREAVEAAIQGNAAAVMEKLDAGGGSVRELATREERIEQIAKDYTQQSAEERAASIVIAPGRDDRQLLNEAIRKALQAAGVLTGQAAATEALVAKDLTAVQARRAENYQVGEILKAGRDYQKWDIERGDYLRVRAIDAGRNVLVAEARDGRLVEVNPRTARRFEAFTAEFRELQQGDRITFKANDSSLARRNGLAATVVTLDAQAGRAVVKTETGQLQSLDLRSLRDGHWTHAYAQTAHEAQGRTCERVFVHAESSRLNLTTQQSLYVAISRAREAAYLYTDSKEALGLAVTSRSGQKAQALNAVAGMAM